MTKIRDSLRRGFDYLPTLSQNLLCDVAGDFIATRQKRAVLLINGYAGTGKSTAINVIIKTLPLQNYRYVLLAPTGRAARLLSQFTKKNVSTIIRKIYRVVLDADKGGYKFKRHKNFFKNTVFIVGEAFMLSDENENRSKGLLTDLIEFVFEHDTNKLVLIGDSAQLSPQGKTESPALCKEFLSKIYGLQVFDVELTDVLGQSQESGILFNATNIRSLIYHPDANNIFRIRGHKAIKKVATKNLEGVLKYAYDHFGLKNTMIICRSNNMAVKYNDNIRRNIFFYEDEVEAGDILMIVRNNYFYLEEYSSTDFLAEGEFVEVRKVIGFEEIYGFRFANLSLKLLDYPEQEDFEAKVILDTLHAMTPSLPLEDFRKLYWEVNKNYQNIKSQHVRNEAVLSDPYLNALQIKYAYALTGHRSLGGQWHCVFVDHGFLYQEMITTGFFRWLYTAITKTTRELYLVDFKATFFME